MKGGRQRTQNKNTMGCKCSNTVIKGFSPDELISWFESEQLKREKEKKWLKKHTITDDNRLHFFNSNQVTEEGIYKVGKKLTSTIKELIDNYSSIIKMLEDYKTK